ncbi:MAG: hypothetical protein VB133_15085 [Anaeromusa sp.]|uniref:hypothetical protein n=1 Tax=Anaeromusa sp. TaxID=1872520 RepID=UPI002B21B7AE|nr:hypothetical protein [Anaeromusa sp.]MEA4836439.1 hypothetical protein [Anaeromusa sp.]
MDFFLSVQLHFTINLKIIKCNCIIPINDIMERDSVSEVTSVEYKTVKEMAEDWGLSERRVRLLCQKGKIDSVVQNGRAYLIPETAVKPVDKRYRKNKNISPLYRAIFAKIDELKHKLNLRRPLTQGELKRLQEEFMIEFTYDSNAIEGNTLTLQETAMVLEGITIDTKPLKDHLEVVGHKEAFGYVKRIVAEKTSFSERVIQEQVNILKNKNIGSDGLALLQEIVKIWRNLLRMQREFW